VQAVSTLKHLAGYSLEQYVDVRNKIWTRQNFSAQISAFDLADTYLPAFQRSITTPQPADVIADYPSGSSGALGVMYSCSELNGMPAIMSRFLNGKLHEWGFEGYR
jgi:beta-glucosidase-like glycosyl hydrolase